MMKILSVATLIYLTYGLCGFCTAQVNSYRPCDVHCLLDPCLTASCPANTGATCVSRCCVPYFYDKYGNDITDRCDCPRGVRAHVCKPDPCDKAKCDQRGQCRTDRCGGCDPVFYDYNANVIPGCPLQDQSTGVCPRLPPGTIGICVELCGLNGCPSPQLCCSNGCGHVCKDPYYPDCPGGRPLACKRPACDVQSCPRQIQATCKATCFGCIAHFYDQFDNDITDDCDCKEGVTPVKCIDDPCRTATCPNRPDAVCRTNACGGKCEAIFYDNKGRSVKCKVPEPTCPPLRPGSSGICVQECNDDDDCPGNKKCCFNGCGRTCRTPLPAGCDSIRCIANACHVQTCATHTQAECEAVCSTCFALFYDKFGNDITEQCNCRKRLPIRLCSDDLCNGKTCPAHPDAECRINSCGRCSTAFFDRDGNEVKCELPQPTCPPVKPDENGICIKECDDEADCRRGLKCCSNGCGRVCRTPLPAGCNSINCLLPACDTASCARHTQAKCVGECNSCFPLFFDKFGNDITSECNCPGRIFEQDCRDDLCDGKICRNYPNAECRINRCGGCSTAFFDRRGKEVECGGIQDPLCPSIAPPGFTPCIAQCSSNDDCSGGLVCCTFGCRTLCTNPQFESDPDCPAPPRFELDRPCVYKCTSNDECRRGQVCCHNSCGSECKDPRQDKRCPAPDPDILENLPVILCPASGCSTNSDCRRGKICCDNGCSKQCINPPPPPMYDERCPPSLAPVSDLACSSACSKNSDCRSDYMCCGQFCGSTCEPKPRTCDPGEFLAKCRNLCKGRSCPNHPTAKCRVHGCNGCRAEFYDKYNRIVTDCLPDSYPFPI